MTRDNFGSKQEDVEMQNDIITEEELFRSYGKADYNEEISFRDLAARKLKNMTSCSGTLFNVHVILNVKIEDETS